MVDEVSSHNKELVPLCIRFVDGERQIREELIEITALPRITGEYIAQAIKDIQCAVLDWTNCRGQGFDGAYNMSSQASKGDGCTKNLINLYDDDLPQPGVMEQELMRWKPKWNSFGNSQYAPNTLAATRKVCDPALFPNIFMLLQMGSMLPVRSCKCERSASTSIENLQPDAMTEDRLSALAMIHTYYDSCNDRDWN
ncbi:hypothetical protein CAPTEDRAFT_187465 [Capitella teleta]|uniref:Uncharacterized protein n=1 Tax=Capitella teleta TaxID=283909 RepID=R7VL57_CAPTE|nr:hypothetical protein CAPTEDRAFT_187465 [Capitella teleta]|eukprot:ELU17325.1 hypothetical protein CAPTEDRAFT_187465 [Capitella teleta]